MIRPSRIACLFMLLFAAPTAADRPSLLGLQAAIDGIVTPPPPAAAGILVVDPGGPGAVLFGLVDVVVAVSWNINCGASSCSPAGAVQAATVRATVVGSASLAALVDLI